MAARYQKLADDAIFLFEGSEADEIAHGSLEASAPLPMRWP